MVKIDQYIRSLLFEHDCVIIPEFGGLLTRRAEAGFVNGKGVYAPSRKKLGFNEVLKLDDGLLIYTISIYEKISRQDALHRVREYVDNLHSRLSAGEKVELKGIGVFTSNQEGKYVFDPDCSTNFDTDCYGLTEVPVKALVQESEIAEEVYQEKYFAETKITENAGRNGIFKWAGWAAAAVLTGLLFFVGAYGDSFSNSQGSANPFQAFNPANIYKNVTEAFSSQKTVDSESLSKPGSVENTSPGSISPELSADSDTHIGSSQIEDIETNAEIPTPAIKKYELIVGSFTTIEAAEKLKEDLIKKGYSSAYIIDRAERKFHKVAALGTDNLNEAYTLRRKLEKVVGNGVWVFEDKSGKDRMIL